MVGGAERQGVVQIRGLRERGVDVIPVIGGPELPWLKGQLEAAGIRNYVVLSDFPHVSTGHMSALQRIGEAAGNLRAWWKARSAIRRLVRERQVDAVMANCVHGWVLTGGPTKHPPLLWRAGTRLGLPAQRVGIRLIASVLKPDAVLPNCRALADEIGPLVDCPTPIVPNGTDTRRFDPDRAAPRFRLALGLGTRPVFGIAARPGHEKGTDLLAEVLELTRKQIPDVHLIVAGTGYRKDEFEAHFRERGLGDNATFVGHVDDIECFYASCDVVVLTSRSNSAEASSNALLEAMAMERPVVATNVAGMPEMIEEGKQGFLAAENDAAGFAAHLIRLLGDPELRRRMGQAGRGRVLAAFAERPAVEKLAQLLTELVGSSRAAAA
jgi:glycosyltransferase involved in cell wall biosynthesis